MKTSKHKFIGLTLILATASISSLSYAGSNKVYTVKAERLIGVAMAKGHKFTAKALDIYSDCQVTANHMKVKRNILGNTPVNSPAHEPSCLFKFFTPGNLASGWKVQAITVISNGNGSWQYMHRPHDKSSLLTIIRAKQTINSSGDLNLRLGNIVLVGPANSRNWKQAIKRAR